MVSDYVVFAFSFPGEAFGWYFVISNTDSLQGAPIRSGYKGPALGDLIYTEDLPRISM